MRLVDADALYASIAKDTYLLTDRINSRDYGMFLVGIKKKIDNAPTISVEVISEDTQTKAELTHIKARLENVEKRLQGLILYGGVIR